MVNLSQDIHPLTDFKRNTSEFMSRMKKTRRPVVLTVNGKAELVVQDAESYQQILDRLERFEAVEAIRLGIAAAEEGRVKPARQALSETSGEAWHFRLTSQNRHWSMPRTTFVSSVMSRKNLKPPNGGFADSFRRSIRSKTCRNAVR